MEFQNNEQQAIKETKKETKKKPRTVKTPEDMLAEAQALVERANQIKKAALARQKKEQEAFIKKQKEEIFALWCEFCVKKNIKDEDRVKALKTFLTPKPSSYNSAQSIKGPANTNTNNSAQSVKSENSQSNG